MYLEKAEEPEIKLPISVGSERQQTNSRKIPTTSLTTWKPLTVWITKKLWKITEESGILDNLTFPLRNLYAGQEVTVRGMEQQLVQNWERSTSRLYIYAE